MRSAGSDHQREGQTEEGVPVVRNAVGDPAAVAGLGATPKGGHHAGGARATGWSRERHGRGPADARSEAEVVRRNPAEEDGVKTAVEMTCCGRQENQKQVFLGAHSPWKS